MRWDPAPPWESRLAQDVLMARRFGPSWRLLNRYRVLVRADGLLYGGLYWLHGSHGHYRYGEGAPSRLAFVFDARSLVSLETLRARGVGFDEMPVTAPDGMMKILSLPRIDAGPKGDEACSLRCAPSPL